MTLRTNQDISNVGAVEYSILSKVTKSSEKLNNAGWNSVHMRKPYPKNTKSPLQNLENGEIWGGK